MQLMAKEPLLIVGHWSILYFRTMFEHKLMYARTNVCMCECVMWSVLLLLFCCAL